MILNAFRAAVVIVCIVLSVVVPAAAEFPNRPIRIVVPSPAGGGSDVTARILGEKLSRNIGQPVVVENKPGAAGNIAADAVAKAKPDGYTLLLSHTGISSINPWVYASLPYDAERDLVPITQVMSGYAIVVVGAQVPTRTLGELVALAKSKPGQLLYGSAGIGSPQHVTGELFKAITGTDIAHLPYKGSAPVITGLIGGEVQLGFEYATVSAPQIQAGRIRALAVAGPRRMPILPDVPTAAEAGLPSFESTVWTGFFAPASTPREVVARLHRELVKVINAPDYVERLTANGSHVVASSPEEFVRFLHADREKWGKIVRAAHVRAE